MISQKQSNIDLSTMGIGYKMPAVVGIQLPRLTKSDGTTFNVYLSDRNKQYEQINDIDRDINRSIDRNIDSDNMVNI